MRAVVYDAFNQLPTLREVSDPQPPPAGAVIRVEATGLCRSDWHGWRGHDPDIHLPHVPGHELAGVVEAVGSQVASWRAGNRVTVPFVCACGDCPQCAAGNHQVCDRQFQPGFTHWGSFAELVAIDHADVNLVALPEALDDVAAASLGCRFATAFRAVMAQGRLAAGEWVAVHGCGGVGLSAVMIAAAAGARVVAVDIDDETLRLASRFGACATVDGRRDDPAEAVRSASGGGVHLSLDALGSPATCAASIAGLRKRGRHVQVGLLPGGGPAVPMDRVIAEELEVLGSHGMPAWAYPPMLAMIADGRLRPQLLVTRRIGLEQAGEALAVMGSAPARGVTVITARHGVL
ncbi:MAG: zinc-dependent alcohol dehydrogenase family protein [Actinomycetota bacterium]|jgi:alcohol dehydrogenase|nr:zinc-dependent alcohol dehydrogenase family protein [Actinomycetota bacterium]